MQLMIYDHSVDTGGFRGPSEFGTSMEVDAFIFTFNLQMAIRVVTANTENDEGSKTNYNSSWAHDRVFQR